MANKIFDDYQGESIKINGVYYKLIGDDGRSWNVQSTTDNGMVVYIVS